MVDFSRSSDQVPVAINSYINYTRAYTLFAVKVFADALLPQNDGAIRPIKAVAREGSFFNPTFPAPSGGRAALQFISIDHRLFDRYSRSSDFIQTYIFPGGLLLDEPRFEALAARMRG